MRRDMEVQVLDVLDQFDINYCASDDPITEKVRELKEEIRKWKNPRNLGVCVEAVEEVDSLDAIDIIDDLLEELEDPKQYLETTLEQYTKDKDENNVEQLVEKLVDACRTGATVSTVWSRRVRDELERTCPELLR